MTDNARKLFELMTKDPKAREEFITCKEREKVLELAKKYGLELTGDDLGWNGEPGQRDVDMDELSSIAGGKTCVCVVGGGGEKSHDHQQVCACPLVGLGFYEHNCGFHGITGDWTSAIRCVCDLGGGGKDTWFGNE